MAFMESGMFEIVVDKASPLVDLVVLRLRLLLDYFPCLDLLHVGVACLHIGNSKERLTSLSVGRWKKSAHLAW